MQEWHYDTKDMWQYSATSNTCLQKRIVIEKCGFIRHFVWVIGKLGHFSLVFILFLIIYLEVQLTGILKTFTNGLLLGRF